MIKNVLNLYYFCIYFKKRPKNDLVLFRFVLHTPQGLKTYQSCRRSFQVNSFRVLADSVVIRSYVFHNCLCVYTTPFQSVGQQVGRSVGGSVTFQNFERFLHYYSCPTIRNWIALYPALFNSHAVSPSQLLSSQIWIDIGVTLLLL